MATSTTAHIYIPKPLQEPLSRYMADHPGKSMSELVQEALRDKLRDEGYIHRTTVDSTY